MASQSWVKVATGLQMVATAAAELASKEARVVASRATRHSTELVASAANSASQSHHVSQTQAMATAVSSVAASQVDQLLKVAQAAAAASEAATTFASSNQPSSSSPFPAATTQSQPDSSYQSERPSGMPPSKISQSAHMASKVQPSRLEHPSDPVSLSSNDSVAGKTVSKTTTKEHNKTHSGTSAVANQSGALADSGTKIRSLPSADKNTLSMERPDAVDVRHLKEGSAVPATRFGRAFGFASLGLGLAVGTAAEGVSRLFGRGSNSGDGSQQQQQSSSLIANASNSDRLAASLCRMRGAALKMGQMLSIQDESLLPPELTRALHRVRQGAEAMPRKQLLSQLESELGVDWRNKFVQFDMLPFAAASIGQVHRAKIFVEETNQIVPVVVKVQYPGVADSIASDLRNLSMLVSMSGFAPKGLFLDNVIRVGEQELKVECDYQRELHNQKRMKALVESDPYLQENRFRVPDVFPEWSSKQVLTSAYCPGGTIDKVMHLSQAERNRIGRAILYLTIQELFTWRVMQTDPQWANYLYDVGTNETNLIDFGATREYSKDFVDGYLRIVWASAIRDESTLMDQSHRMQFLTGEENADMLRAHKLSGFTVGEPFHSQEPFDFRGSSISSRMGEHTSVFLRHRLTPPPEEVYTLHRKLAGAYMLCIKLGAVVPCRDLLENVVVNHDFQDGLGQLAI